MAQRHMDRLSGLDASFLTNESDSSHMHVGAILILEGPPPSYEQLRDHVRGRLHLVPRFRQKLASAPAPTGRPFWIDDPAFNIDYHLRDSALPAPGSEQQLRRMSARIFSQQLDRSKPLWEIWMVQGLTRDRFALVTKTHHALVDGVSGVDIATVLFDLEAEPPPQPEPPAWAPHANPSRSDFAARSARGLAGLPIGLARRAARAIEDPADTVRQFGELTEAAADVAWTFANPAPKLPLNVEIGSYRRLAWVRSDLGRFKRIKDQLGGTVNDVVLAVVTGGLRAWLRSRQVKVGGLEIRAQVPVSIRAQNERGGLGNRITAVRAGLPVYIDDPVSRYLIVRESMDGVKQSKQALGAEVISRFNDFAPPTLLAQAARIQFSTRLFNLIVTNVPGPQIPLYVLGRKLDDVFPVGFLPPNQGLFVAIMSYNGGVNFGLLADYDSMEDVEAIAAGIERSISELAAAAESLDGVTREAESDPDESGSSLDRGESGADADTDTDAKQVPVR